MSTNVIDRLVAHKIMQQSEGDVPGYTSDVARALEAVDSFTRAGGNVRLVKLGAQVWEVTAWARAGGRQHTENGGFANALCRAMLAAIGVSVMSSDG